MGLLQTNDIDGGETPVYRIGSQNEGTIIRTDN